MSTITAELSKTGQALGRETDVPQSCETCTARPLSVCNVLSYPQLRRLADCGAVRAYAPREDLVREGEPADFAFNITEGMVMLFHRLPDNRRQVLGFLLKGDFLGLAAGANYDLSVQALTPVKACRFPRQGLRRLLLKMPKLEEELLARASDELVAARAHLSLLGRKTAIERLSILLLDLADRQARVDGSCSEIELPMTRIDIADHLGLTPETVSRSLAVLRRLKAIQVTAGGAKLLKPDLLRSLAEAPEHHS